MNRREAFIRWVAETFDANAFYTVEEETLKLIERDWESWEEALFQWDILTGDESGEELYKKLKSLSPDEAHHIGDSLKEAYTERFNEELWYEVGWDDLEEAKRWYIAGWDDPEESLRWNVAGWDKPKEALKWYENGWDDLEEAKRWHEAGWKNPETALEWYDARWSMEDSWDDPKEALSWHKAGWEDPSDALGWRINGWKDPEEALRWYKAGGLIPGEALEWYEAGWKWDPEIAGELNSLLETAIEKGEVNYKVMDKAVEFMEKFAGKIASPVKRERQRKRGLSP